MKEILDSAIDGFLRQLIEVLPPAASDKLGITERVERAQANMNRASSESLGRFSHLQEYSTIDFGRRAQAAIYQSLWLRELAYKMFPRATESNHSESSGYDVQETTHALISLMYATLKGLVIEFNELISDVSSMSGLRISTTDVSEVKEEDAVDDTSQPVRHFRCRASSAIWSLTIRGWNGRIEFFLVPASEIMRLSKSETPARLKNVVQLHDRSAPGVWAIDSLPADPDELYYVVRNAFRHLVFNTVQGLKDDMVAPAMFENLEGEALRETVRELLMAEQNMAQKIVSQQEEIQNRIARDLHDAVIADIMALKRQLSGDRKLAASEMIAELDKVSQKLRDICHDLAPRDLIDWGLKTVIADLLQRVEERTGADCIFDCEGDLPDFPYPVQLHIYRIVQEVLNNVEKYAQASRITVVIKVFENLVRLSVRDDGKGFILDESDSGRKAREGGTGLSGIKERAEMIRCFYPARIKFESAPGEGTTSVLEIRFRERIG